MTAGVMDQEASKKLGPEGFVAYVRKICQTKKTQSDLRRGLGLPVERCSQAHRYLVPVMGHARLHRESERAHYAIAALIAARPRVARDADAAVAAEANPGGAATRKRRERPNFGASFAAAVNAGAMKPKSAESELHLLTRQSSEAIHERLPALTRQLLGAGVTVDWAVLLDDLSWWNRHQERIATGWLMSYFRGLSDPETGGTHEDGADTEPRAADGHPDEPRT